MISADRPVAAALGDLCPSASAATLVELARAGRVRAFRHHDAITSSDEPPRLVLLLEGHAGSWRSDPEGRRRLVAINGPGEFAGLTGLAASEAIELVGLTDGEAAIWGRDEVLEASRRDGGLAADLLELTLHASARLLTRLDHVSFDSVSRRLARLLWQRRDLLFDRRRPLLTRPELADLAGATREMTDRVIRDLETQGIVQRVGTAGLVLLDPDRLRIVADVESDERECS